MAGKLKLRRGIQNHLPALEEGELVFTTDTKRLYVGTNTGNKEIGIPEDVYSKNDIDAMFGDIDAALTEILGGETV